jgi:hypothetical protein
MEVTGQGRRHVPNPPVKVPRPVFMYGVAEGLLEESQVFDRKHANDPEKLKIVPQLASDCLKPAQQSDDES